MTLPLILLIIFTLFFIFSLRIIIQKGDDLYVIGYTTLFIYSIFAQIGYAYFPEFSILLGAYFGADLFYEYWGFMFFSFVSSFLLYLLIKPYKSRPPFYGIKESNYTYKQWMFLSIISILLISLVIYFLRNRDLFHWGGGNSMSSVWFALFFRLLIGATLILYVKYRKFKSSRFNRFITVLLFFTNLIFIIVVTTASGSRSDILYFFIGILTFELQPFRESLKYKKKNIFYLILTSIVIIAFLQKVMALRVGETNRGLTISKVITTNVESTNTDESIFLTLLMQDYYSPSHTLYVSMNYKIIDLVEVLKSNFANTFIGFNYPTISATITSRIGLDAERGAGWSYHQFVEGYNAMGWLGIFYNAIFWNLGMYILKRVSTTNSRFFSVAITAIISLFIINMMRSQTYIYIRFLWMNIIPLIFLLLLATNSKIVFFRKKG